MTQTQDDYPACFREGSPNCLGDYACGSDMCEFCEFQTACISGADPCEFCEYESECKGEVKPK